jgi:GNAT superfamily N-acetyltransferase
VTDAAGPTADVSVRLAKPRDAAAIAGVQRDVWLQSYATLLPPAVADEFDLDEAIAGWKAAITAPPSHRHLLLVALENREVVGFSTHGPAEDADLDAQTTGELLAVHVSPAHLRAGHGSRLMAALVDHARSDGFAAMVGWVFAADDAVRAFLRATGWEADGATRDLDLGQLVHQVRLHTDIRSGDLSITDISR